MHRMWGCVLLALLAGCSPTSIDQDWQDCLQQGGKPSHYLREFSAVKTQGVYCDAR